MDEIIHSCIGNDKRWVLGWRIFAMRGMVVIVTQQNPVFKILDVLILQKRVNLLRWGMNEHKRRNKRLCYDSLLSLLPYLFIPQRHIAFQAFSLY